ncbi:PPE family protein [Mycobacterium sp. M1]|uniref:PPE family protein n=1 Tax=Mycolicibacter acidiphilus TaxID=2835306 RepID=A0ABS5RHN8_9MYCO|nr:PPE family protein [Mycolicibacter acidiphilus]MBS9533827.1 PPE family protein [Mycolicibacter acidiphilus]
MVNFAGLPPEVVSGRLYAGSGSAPLVAAASAWDRLAATLGSAAVSYRSVVTQLVDESWQAAASAWDRRAATLGSAAVSYRSLVTQLVEESWQGAASAAMAAAAQPYVEWMNTTAAQAAATAGQVRAAAAAFEAAHAGAVPPAAVAANRAALTSLVSGNVLGQNSGAIAANQAEYSAMWAQDAAVMQTYAAGSAAATKSLPALTAAPQVAGSADGTETTTPTLTDLANQILKVPIVQELSAFLGSVDGWDQNIVVGGLLDGFIQYSFIVPQIVGAETAALGYGTSTGLIGTAAAVTEVETPLTLAGSYTASISGAGAGTAGSAAGGVSAGLGRAAPVGGLSVPASWAPAARDIRLAVAAAPLNGSAGVPAGGWVGGIPPIAGMVNAPTTGGPGGRHSCDPSPKVVPALARPGGVDPDIAKPAARAGAGAAAAAAPAGKRAELDRLRKLAGDLAKERDVLEQSAESLLELAGVRPDGPRR